MEEDIVAKMAQQEQLQKEADIINGTGKAYKERFDLLRIKYDELSSQYTGLLAEYKRQHLELQKAERTTERLWRLVEVAD